MQVASSIQKTKEKIPKKSKEMESQGKKPSHREIETAKGGEEGKGKRGRDIEKEVNQVKGKASERATKLLPQPRNADNFCHLILSFALFLHSRNTLQDEQCDKVC